MEAWKAKHFFQRIDIDPRVVLEPQAEIRIRETTASHVEKLKESFLATRTKNPNVSLVALGFKGYRSVAELIKYGLQAWEGLHTTKACAKLAAAFPKNQFWQTYQADVYICDDTSENRRVLRLVGNLSNFKSSIHLDLKFADMLKMQHDQMYAEKARLGLAEDADLPKGTMEEMKRDWCYSTGQSHANISSVWNIARTRGRVWERIWKIVSGNLDDPVKSKAIGYRPPGSTHHFNFMSKIDEDTLCDLLDEVIRGETTTHGFKLKCEKVRGVMRMRREILEWIVTTNLVPKAKKTKVWDEAKERFSSVCSQDFCSVWEGYFSNLTEKESPQRNFFEQLEARMKADLSMLEAVTTF